MSYSNSVKKDLGQVAILIFVALFVFYPVLYSSYAYTDELVGLWQWNTAGHSPTAGLLQYGRYVTGKMGEWLFSSIDTIDQLTWIRTISFAGWLVCIPIWFYLLKRIAIKEKLSQEISFFSVLFLICTPAVAISIGWAACFELFFANTLGLLSGYFLYSSLTKANADKTISIPLLLLSILCGVVCLFTYQNGFGCFLLPFLLHFISSSALTGTLWKAIAFYFIIYTVYYLLFKLSLNLVHVDESTRTGLHINVGRKLPFFLARPLGSAFRLTLLANERDITGYVLYGIIAASWFLFSWIQKKGFQVIERVKYFLIVFCLLGLVYLPSLVVSENYSSNRTMLALSMAVFFLMVHAALVVSHTQRFKLLVIIIASLLFVANAWYNFNLNFLSPVKEEYSKLRTFVESNYKAGTDSIYFLRPTEDFFEKKYGITRSWDEFGVPSSFFQWTPEFLVRQVVFEKTKDRSAAEKLVIQSAIIDDTGFHSASANNSLLINAPEILK